MVKRRRLSVYPNNYMGVKQHNMLAFSSLMLQERAKINRMNQNF